MDKYLLEILKKSNTIIIPGLGALTITNNETGETMFMPYLQHDDGKLAGFIAEKDGIEVSDAKIMVAKYVREIQAELDKGESYSMFELGSFVKADDGDIEFTHWSSLGAKKEEDIAVVAPIVEEIVIADAPKVDPEVIPEPVAEVEPVVEPEPEVIPEPEFDADEVELKNAIEEALVKTSKPEVAPAVEAVEKPIIPKEVIPEIKPEPVIEKISSAAADATLGGMTIPEEEVLDAALPEEQGAGLGEEKESKDKPTPKFWITMIIIALLIIAGGAYVGRNYHELKQHIPFLADAKEDVEPENPKDEIESNDKVDRTYKPVRSAEDGAGGEEGNSMEDGNSTEEVTEKETPVEPETIEKPEPVTAPVTSSSGHYHVIAGAFSSEANANRLSEEFKAKGLNSSVFKKGELNAVSMQSYATSEEANANLAKLQGMAPGAWILYK